MHRKLLPMALTLALLAAISGPARAGVKSKTVYVDDIDAWKVEVFAGASNSGGLMQGPAIEAGVGGGGSMCFFPTGEGFIAAEGVVMTLGRDEARTVRFLAGTPGVPGYADGPASQALLGRQISITPDGKGGLWIGDRTNRCVRRLAKKENAWVVETVAGDPAKPGWGREPTDGTGKDAVFKYLHSNVAADAEGNAYIIDRNFLRRIAPEGKAETLNPGGGSGKPGDGALEGARFNLIMGGGLCLGGDGCLYVADRWNHCIRKVDLAAKTVSTVVGPGRGYVDGPQDACGFHDSPGHIVWDPWRKRFNTNGVDDWGVRVWQDGWMRTIAGGGRSNKAMEGPARKAGIHWGGTRAIDPMPPHDIYFWSNGGGWRGRIGRLYKEGGNP